MKEAIQLMKGKNALSIHEAAILLDGYLEGKKHEWSNLDTARKMSVLLRRMAVNCGKSIDDSYRSIPGILNRMRSLECAYTGDSSAAPSTLFNQIVSIYRTDYLHFEQILSEAKTMIFADTDRKSQFYEWISVHAPRRKMTWVEINLHRVDTFCRHRNHFSTALFEQHDKELLGKIRQDICKDKMFRASCGKGYEKLLADFDLFCTFCHETEDATMTIRTLKDNEFTLADVPDLAYTKPTSFTYANEQPEIVKNWSTLYRNVLHKLGRDRIEQLRAHWGEADFSSSGLEMLRPYELWPNLFTEMNFSATDLVKRLVSFFDYCNIDTGNLLIEYKKTGVASTSSQNETVNVPEVLVDIIRDRYVSGIRFDDTVLNLLSNQCSTQVTKPMCDRLCKEMFKRSDGLYFLVEQIADKDTIQSIKQKLTEDLDQFLMCEVSALYQTACTVHTINCIRNSKDYADFLLFLFPEGIRINNALTSKIVRRSGTSTSIVTAQLAEKVLASIKENGCMTEEDLLIAYPIVSAPFMKKLLEKGTDEVVTTSINDFLCYQTIEAMGFDESFSELLHEILEKIDALELTPTIDTLHTLLSVQINQNFCNTYGIPDEKTFRKIIAMYYCGEKLREWKAGSFMEVKNGNV